MAAAVRAKPVMSTLLITLICAGATRSAGTRGDQAVQGAEAAMKTDTIVETPKIISTAERALLLEDDLFDVSIVRFPKTSLCCCNQISSLTTPVKYALDKATKKKVVHPGRCVVGTVDGSNAKRQCKKMNFPEWARDTPMHKASTLKIPCKVHKDDVKDVVINHDQRDDYCKEPSGRLHSETIPQCDDGFQPVAGKVKCEYESIKQGSWLPAQNCQEDPAWCEGSGFQRNWEDVHLSDTVLNGVAFVECRVGHVPKPEQVTCMASRKFEPEPKCEPILDFCSLDNENSAQPWVNPTTIGSYSEVHCDLGYQASESFVQCIGDQPGDKQGRFHPMPSCMLVGTWCKGEPVNPVEPQKGSTRDGALGHSEMVYCKKGWVPDGADTTECQSDGKWMPEPKCKKG